MSRNGNYWDNSVAKSLFGNLKQERAQWKQHQARTLVHQDVLNYIMALYNSYHLHTY